MDNGFRGDDTLRWRPVPDLAPFAGDSTLGLCFRQPRRASANAMKPKISHVSDELRPEYDCDYSKGVRGKYYKRILKEGANVVVLEPDVAKAFPDSAAVNDALRIVLKAGQAARRLTSRSSRPARKPAAA